MSNVNLCNWEKFSCFGCCGFDFASRGKIENKLKEQAELWKKLGTKKFSEREISYVEKEGICGHQVLVDGKVFCATHPAVYKNKGKDYREPRCIKEHLCKTYQEFLNWEEEKQNRFLEFLRKKNLDWYDYSIGMDNNSLIEEFEKINKK